MLEDVTAEEIWICVTGSKRLSRTIKRALCCLVQSQTFLRNCCCLNKRENLNSFPNPCWLDKDATLARLASLLFRSRDSRHLSKRNTCRFLERMNLTRRQKSLLPANANIKRLRNAMLTSRLIIASSLSANSNGCFHRLNNLTIHHKISNT